MPSNLEPIFRDLGIPNATYVLEEMVPENWTAPVVQEILKRLNPLRDVSRSPIIRQYRKDNFLCRFHSPVTICSSVVETSCILLSAYSSALDMTSSTDPSVVLPVIRMDADEVPKFETTYGIVSQCNDYIWYTSSV